VGQLLLGDPERPRESQLRCDPLIDQEYQKSVQELHANLDYAEKELEEVRAQAEAEQKKHMCEISELTFEVEKLNDHSKMVSASHKRFQQVYFATTTRCDELILKVRDLERKNTNQVNLATQETENLLSQLQRAQEECRIEAKACRESKQLCNELNEESRSYKEDVDALKRSCEMYKESMEDDRQALWGINTLNQKLLDGIVSADKWLGKDNRDNFKMMLVRGGAPTDVIDEALL
jgi:chromosome segregation ATPase